MTQITKNKEKYLIVLGGWGTKQFAFEPLLTRIKHNYSGISFITIEQLAEVSKLQKISFTESCQHEISKIIEIHSQDSSKGLAKNQEDSSESCSAGFDILAWSMAGGIILKIWNQINLGIDNLFIISPFLGSFGGQEFLLKFQNEFRLVESSVLERRPTKVFEDFIDACAFPQQKKLSLQDWEEFLREFNEQDIKLLGASLEYLETIQDNFQNDKLLEPTKIQILIGQFDKVVDIPRIDELIKANPEVKKITIPRLGHLFFFFEPVLTAEIMGFKADDNI